MLCLRVVRIAITTCMVLAAVTTLWGCAHGIGGGDEIGGEAEAGPDAGSPFEETGDGPDAAPAEPCTGGLANFEDPMTGACYMLFDNQQNWDAARVACEALGPGHHLATVADAGEGQLIADLAGDHEIWMAGSDAGNEGNWVWYNGDPLAFTRWRSGEPNDGGGDGEDCMILEGQLGGTWDDRHCGDSYRFVCERD